jgi:nucleotide-binding universal stress UspA family protein
MKKLLVCTDGSLYADSIYDHAAWAAQRLPAAVHVVHMLDPHHERAQTMDHSGNLGPDTGDELLAELVNLEEKTSRLAREQGKRILQNAEARLRERGLCEVTTEQQHGALVEAVARLEESAELLVIGKRGGKADFAKLHLGSNLERVIRASIRPVLVASRQFVPIERFLLAYDGGPSMEKAIAYAINEPLLRGLPCHLVRAGRLDDQARWFLHETEAKLRDAGFSVTVHAVPGHPEQVIASLVKELDIHLLVMGAYGHSRIRHLMVGSTTTEMVRTCLIPVLMFR